MERRLTAILCADVVGYSALMGADEAMALATIKRLRDKLFEPEVNRFHGHVVKRIGDGWVVEFASVVDAVDCAISFQQKMGSSNDAQLRIGIHIGDIVCEDGEIYGDGINIAARLESIGAPGCVLISDDVRRQILGKTDAVFHDNGEMALKNIAAPARVWSWPNPLERPKQADGRSARKPSVHVAKFEARGNGAEDFAEAVRDDLSTSFARQTALAMIADETKVDYIVSGAVRAFAGRWRITAQLTDRANDVLVWSERYEDDKEDLFELQDHCVFQITGAVRSRITLHRARQAADLPQQELSVEELLNLAMLQHYEPTRESSGRAVAVLKTVLQRDPNNWMAMAMLCFNLVAKEHLFGWRESNAADVERARDLAEYAQRLNPDSDSVRIAHGFFLLFEMRDHDAARIEAEHALFLSPNYYSAHWLLGLVECTGGAVEKGKRHALLAANSNPSDPLRWRSLFGAGIAHLVDGEHRLAADWFLHASRAAPELPQNMAGLAVSFQLAGDTGRAASATASLMRLAPDFNLQEFCPWPFRDAENRQQVADALAAAGAPLDPPSAMPEKEGS